MIAATILDTPDSVSANPFAKEQALRLNRLLPLHLAALSKRSATGQRLHYQCHLPADQIGGQLRQPILAIISEAILDRHVVTLDEPASEMVVQGFSNREIAQRLGIAEGTVKFQLHRIYERLGVRNRLALAALIFTDRALSRAQDRRDPRLLVFGKGAWGTGVSSRADVMRPRRAARPVDSTTEGATLFRPKVADARARAQQPAMPVIGFGTFIASPHQLEHLT